MPKKTQTPSFRCSSVSDDLSADLRTDKENSLEKRRPAKAEGCQGEETPGTISTDFLSMCVVKEASGTKCGAGDQDQPRRLRTTL